MILFSKVQNSSRLLFSTYVLLQFQGLVQGTTLHLVIVPSKPSPIYDSSIFFP